MALSSSYSYKLLILKLHLILKQFQLRSYHVKKLLKHLNVHIHRLLSCLRKEFSGEIFSNLFRLIFASASSLDENLSLKNEKSKAYDVTSLCIERK